MSEKIRNFTDLNAWKESHKLVLEIYRITKNFPREEIFGLTSQMRRAAVSVTSNIAEGFGRYSGKEQVQFFYISFGSLTELKNQIIISKDIKYISETEYRHIDDLITCSQKIISGLIKYKKNDQ
ncbi:MAG: four helix bundle protein [bacterium]